MTQTSDRSIVIIASEECKHTLQHGRSKTWFHVREFVAAHYQLLKRFTVFSTDGTAAIIDETTRTMKRLNRNLVGLKVQRVGPTSRGVSRLAAMVAEGKIGRVLFFQDPNDLEMDKPENYALLRNCDLHGKHLCINESAELWARHEERSSLPPPQRAPEISKKETVALIAHDAEKARMAFFVLRHHRLLGRFKRLVATSGTKAFVEDCLKRTFGEDHLDKFAIQKLGTRGSTAKKSHGPAGGDVIIAQEIYETYEAMSDRRKTNLPGPLYHILFFMDHKHSQPHEPDIRVLVRTCVNPELRVNLVLNSKMADEWIRRYERRKVPNASRKTGTKDSARVRKGDPDGFQASGLRGITEGRAKVKSVAAGARLLTARKTKRRSAA